MKALDLHLRFTLESTSVDPNSKHSLSVCYASYVQGNS